MREQYKAVATREGNLSFFKYTCVGYSIFSHGEDSPTKEQNKPASLPVCVGYEVFYILVSLYFAFMALLK